MAVAKARPRDEMRAIEKIKVACRRRRLAEQSQYAFPRGGQTVEGPSIRLAEALALSWGNMNFGIVELDQKSGESEAMAYALDLESNVRAERIFTVKHVRHTRQGIKRLDDPRDVYELVANNGARRLRACILELIPGDVVDLAVDECNKTLAGDNKEPFVDRLRAMVERFGVLNVTVDMLERRLGHKVDSTTEAELLQMGKVYNTIKDNVAKVADYFPPAQSDAPKAKGDALADRLKGGHGSLLEGDGNA